ncbi:hypothetical protein Leryth_026931 [Lithospermum erythrorhizon]|nr:hypothetical protein Leryth_026931 [Lithospermum erythrorhizon]
MIFSGAVLNHGEDSDCYLTLSSLSSSCPSSELEEDASSSPSFSPLFHLCELMGQLPIKRGLSKYYDGKSESFTSLASVGNLEDIVKKGALVVKESSLVEVMDGV